MILWYNRRQMKKIGILIERQRAYGRSLCSGIAQYAQGCDDWSLKMLEWEDLDRPKRLLDFDGFIVRILNDRMARILRRLGKPVVDVFHERDRDGISAVDQHAVRVGQLAARHFIEHRFVRFAFCGFDGRRYSDARRDAFVHCLELNHFRCEVYPSPPSAISDFDNTVIRRERLAFSVDNGQMGKWIRSLPKPIGVFCAHDLRAYQLIEICNQAGIRVPEDVAVLGVDNDELVCNFVTPTLSSIDLNGKAVGFTAAKLLAEQLDGRVSGPRRVSVDPSGLVERKSTQIYPIDPPWLSDALIFIRNNVSRRLTAADVYAHVKRSHTLVTDAFKRALDTTVQKEIQRTRLAEALRLVTGTSLSLAEIAVRAGFASMQYFCTSFTAAYGKPPSAFR